MLIEMKFVKNVELNYKCIKKYAFFWLDCTLELSLMTVKWMLCQWMSVNNEFAKIIQYTNISKKWRHKRNVNKPFQSSTSFVRANNCKQHCKKES